MGQKIATPPEKPGGACALEKLPSQRGDETRRDASPALCSARRDRSIDRDGGRAWPATPTLPPDPPSQSAARPRPESVNPGERRSHVTARSPSLPVGGGFPDWPGGGGSAPQLKGLICMAAPDWPAPRPPPPIGGRGRRGRLC